MAGKANFPCPRKIFGYGKSGKNCPGAIFASVIIYANGMARKRILLLTAGWTCRIFNFQNPTASDLVNELSVEELEKIFREYGEEKLSKEIAKAMVENRKEKRIERVGDLVEIILTVYRNKLKSKKEIPWVGGLHPATKVFQALRMAVNDELGVLEKVLPQAIEILASGGRLSVITFHSLEDRIVKHFFKDQEGKTIKIISKKPIVCSSEEYKANSRARSAKLRVVEKR